MLFVSRLYKWVKMVFTGNGKKKKLICPYLKNKGGL